MWRLVRTGADRRPDGEGAVTVSADGMVAISTPTRPVADRIVVELVRQAWRRRRGLAPVYGASATGTAGALLTLPPDGHRTAVALAATAAVMTAAWCWWRGRYRRRWQRPHLAYIAGVWAASWAWIVTVAWRGIGPPLPGMLLAGMLLAGGPWWWHHRIRAVPALHEAVQRWELEVGSTGGALPGSWITDPTPVRYAPPGEPCDGRMHTDETETACDECGGTGRRPGQEIEVGWQATIQLPPGRSTTSRAIGSVEMVASAFGTSPASVAIEETSTGRADQACVRVYGRNPLQDVRVWPGPHLYDPETGIAHIGVYVDEQPVLYRFFEPGMGPLHDLISGTTGAGKSSILNVLLGIERYHGYISVVIDPKNGASLPDWQDSVATYARGAKEGVEVLLLVERHMQHRNRILGDLAWTDDKGRPRKGISFFDPTFRPIQELGMRLICLTVDEAHQVLEDADAVAAAENISKIGRSAGVKLRLVTQVPLVDQLGGSSTLKEMVRSGTVICLRTGSRLSGEVAFSGEVPVDPVMLPRRWPDGSKTAGLCFVLGEEARSAQARLYEPGDAYGWAHRGTTTPLDDLPADPEDHDLAPGRARVDPAALEDAMAEVDQASQELLRQLAADTAGGTAQTAAPGRAGGTARQRVVAYLGGKRGGATVSTIADVLGIPPSTVATALKEAAAGGEVEQAKRRGPWRTRQPEMSTTEQKGS